jgi:cytochrome b6-f complex iron-sulfur subunit
MNETREHYSTTRRSFLGKLMFGTVLAGVVAAVGSVVAYLLPSAKVSARLNQRRAKVGKTESIAQGKGKLVLVDDEPVWVVHLPSGFIGMSALCTHRGCIVRWEEKLKIFSCPCHDGHFDDRGNVVAGLPRQPLTHFRVGLVNGDVYVARRRQPKA